MPPNSSSPKNLSDEELRNLDKTQPVVIANPSILSERVLGNPVLHRACKIKAGSDVIQFLVTQHPAGLEQHNYDGYLPLHLACHCQSYSLKPSRGSQRMEPTLSVVQLVAERYPQALRDVFCGATPLAIACMSDCSLSIIQYLVHQDPFTLKIPDQHGRLPWHLSCQFTSRVEVLEFMYTEQFKNKMLHKLTGTWKHHALHCVCKNRTRCASMLVRWTVSHLGVKGLHIMSRDKQLPLHEACWNTCLDSATVDYVVNSYPEAATIRGSCGRFPLHLVCMARPSERESLFTLLLALFPDAANIESDLGETALYLVCQRRVVCADVVKVLLRLSPEGASISIQGMLPIDSHCKNGNPLSTQVVRLLAKANPDCVRGRLRLACKNPSAPVDAVKFLANKAPEELLRKDTSYPYGTPVHSLLVAKNFEAALVLLQMCPRAATQIDYHGQLPLHYACRYDAPLDVIQALVRAYPAAVATADKSHDEWLPIHYAVKHGIKAEAVGYLLDCHRESTRCSGRDRKIPLHIACMYCEDVSVLDACLERDFDSIRVQDSFHNCALHLACQKMDKSIDVVSFLIKSDPGVLYITNDCGALPIHIACAGSGISLPLLRILVKASPSSVRQKDYGKGKDLPLHILCRNKWGPLDAVEFLVEKYPYSVLVRNKRDEMPLDVAKSTGKIALLEEAQKRVINDIKNIFVSLGLPEDCFQLIWQFAMK